MVLDGVLVIDKPKGPTSFDVVRAARNALKALAAGPAPKLGHTGTLDPMATGVLPVRVGQATKVAQFITEQSKSYEAQLKLGQATDTLDAEGRVVAEALVPTLDAVKLEAVLAKFRGTFMQTPPMYSAVKVGGRRLYELARAGEEVERAAREVTVTALVVHDFSADTIRLSVTASKGFFVRTLAAELGEALGTVAHLTALRRTHSGLFSLAQAVPLEQVVADPGAAALRLLPVSEALASLPVVTVTEAEAGRVSHGVPLELAQLPQGLVRVVGPGGVLLAVAEASRGRLSYRRVLVGA